VPRAQHVTLRVTAVVVLTAGLVLVGGVGGGTAASSDASVNTTNTTDVLWATSLGSLDALTNTTATTVDSANTTVANTTDALNDTIGAVENTTTVANTTDALGDTTAETSAAVEGTTALILTETTTTLDDTTTTLESTVESPTDEPPDAHETLTGFGLLAEESRTVADPGDGRDATAHAPRQRRQDRPERSAVTDDPARAIVVDAPTEETEGAAGTTGAAEGADSTPQVPPPVAGAAVGMQAILAVAAVRELAGSPARVQTAATVGRELVDGLPRVVVPLRYSRYDDSDPLAHETRAAVLEAIDDAPGVYLTELGEQTDVTLSTLRHHVRVLEDENLVASAHIRGRSRFYPAHTEDVELAAALNDDATAPIVEALTRMGPATVSELAAVDSRDASTITHHLQNLEDDGVVVREREGRAILNQLAPDVRELLAPADLDAELPDVETALSAD